MLTVKGLVRQHMVLVYREASAYWGSAYITLVGCAERYIASGNHHENFVGYAAKSIHFAKLAQRRSEGFIYRRRVIGGKRVADYRTAIVDPTIIEAVHSSEPFASPSSLAEARDEHKRKVRFSDDLHRLPRALQDAAFLMLCGTDSKTILSILQCDEARLRFLRYGLIEALGLENDNSHKHFDTRRNQRVIEARRAGYSWPDVCAAANLARGTAMMIWEIHCELTGEQDIRDKVVQMDRQGRTPVEIERETSLPMTRILSYISTATNTKLTEAHRQVILGLLHHGWRYRQIALFMNVSARQITEFVDRTEKQTGRQLKLPEYSPPTPQIVVERIIELARQGASPGDIQAFVQIRRSQVVRILRREKALLPSSYEVVMKSRPGRCHYGLSENKQRPVFSDEQLLGRMAPLRRTFWSFHRIADELRVNHRRLTRIWFNHCQETGELDSAGRLAAMRDSGLSTAEIAERTGLSHRRVARVILSHNQRAAAAADEARSVPNLRLAGVG